MRYEKGHKDASRRRIIDVAAARFRSDGIAASGIAGIMEEAGLTNGAFYAHFSSKADLVAACLTSALEAQSCQIKEGLATGGFDAVLDYYLSPAHRDDRASGCVSAALLPEIEHQAQETRGLYADHLDHLVKLIAETLAPRATDPQSLAIGIYVTMMGTLQLARTIADPGASDQILAAGKAAVRAQLAVGSLT
jgi:AcrR family transcriptional regulator